MCITSVNGAVLSVSQPQSCYVLQARLQRTITRLVVFLLSTAHALSQFNHTYHSGGSKTVKAFHVFFVLFFNV